MRFHELNEAPLADFGTFGHDQEGSFRPEDLRAMRNPKWIQKIGRMFEKSKYDFNVYLCNVAEAKINLNGEDHDLRDIEDINRYSGVHPHEQVEKLIGRQIPNADNAITVLLLQNEGDERLALTPWMVAHRVAHALLVPSENSPLAILVDDLMSDISRRLHDIDQFLRLHGAVSARANFDIDWRTDQTNRIGKLIGKIRSLRMGNLANDGEFFVECFTQHIVQGKVEFARPLVTTDGRSDRPKVTPEDEQLLKMARQTNGRNGFLQKVLRIDINNPPTKPTAAQKKKLTVAHETAPELIRKWDEWNAQGLLASEVQRQIRRTPTDVMDDRLDALEAHLNQQMDRILYGCVGRAMIL